MQWRLVSTIAVSILFVTYFDGFQTQTDLLRLCSLLLQISGECIFATFLLFEIS